MADSVLNVKDAISCLFGKKKKIRLIDKEPGLKNGYSAG
jgi:hypothetical protein